MRQPPRQPPRQPARNTARRAAPKASPKAAPRGGARGAKGATRAAPKGGKAAPRGQSAASARAAQHARDAQRAAQRANQARGRAGARGRPGAQRGRASASHRSWRSWWATAEMDRRQKAGMTGAGPARVGVFASMRHWSGARLASVFTLLLLAFFTCSIALGAGSVVAGIVAFAFLVGAIALATAARAAEQFRSGPPMAAPMESVKDFRIEDLTLDEEPDGFELNSLDDLDRTFKDADQKEPAPPAQAAEPATGDEKSAEPPPEAAGTDEPDPVAVAEQAGTDFAGEPTVEAAEADATEQPSEPTLEPTLEQTPDPTPEAAGEAGDEPKDDAPAEPVIPRQPSRDDVTERGDDAGVLAANTPHGDDAPEPDEPSGTVGAVAASQSTADVLSAYVTAEEGLPAEAVRDVAATLLVSDLDRSLMFYSELLGLVEIDRAADAVLLEAGFGRVLLWQREDAPSGGNPVMHLTFEVGDIDVAYDALRAKGIAFTHPPRSALSGAVHDVKAASFLDPDGHGLAITELTQR